MYLAQDRLTFEQIWEPTLRELVVENAASPEPLDIQEIWLWEAVNHGDAALINAGKLGGLCTFTESTDEYSLTHMLLQTTG